MLSSILYQDLQLCFRMVCQKLIHTALCIRNLSVIRSFTCLIKIFQQMSLSSFTANAINLVIRSIKKNYTFVILSYNTIIPIGIHIQIITISIIWYCATST